MSNKVYKDTLVLHTGNEFDKHTGAVSMPIYQVSTYQQTAPGEHRGFEYSRTENPTRAALEQTMAVLENGKRGLAFASGMAAISTVFMLFNSGDHVIVSDDVYGGTYRVLNKVFSRLGLVVSYIDTTNLEAIEKAITSATKAIFIESPTNPLMKVTNINRVGEIAHNNKLLLIVDNTFMTPYWQNPITLGADVVIHSATKYLAGHSDVVAGMVVTATDDLGDKLHFLQNAVGAILGPYDAWLIMRGIKTLALRMEKHEQNARIIAEWLTKLPVVQKVYYPGLTTHPQHEIAVRQAQGFGGMLSFELTSKELADQLVCKVRLITLAESLGAVESLIGLPVKMSHASVPIERKIELGITDRLVRLSVGIENINDIQEDIIQALGL